MSNTNENDEWIREKIEIRSIEHFERMVEILNEMIGVGSKNWHINKPVRSALTMRRFSSSNRPMVRTLKIRASFKGHDQLIMMLSLI